MEGQPTGGWGAGADPSSMLMFLLYAVSNKRKTVVRRSYPLTIFLISSSSLGQVPRSDPTSRDGDLRAPPAMFGRPPFFIAGNYWVRMREKMVCWEPAGGLPTWECRDV